MSDYDIAVYLDEQLLSTDLRLTLAAELGRTLKTDRLDLVILNRANAPALKYSIISEGRLFFERDSSSLDIEPRILNEYFDFQIHLIRHGLTKAIPAQQRN